MGGKDLSKNFILSVISTSRDLRNSGLSISGAHWIKSGTLSNPLKGNSEIRLEGLCFANCYSGLCSQLVLLCFSTAFLFVLHQLQKCSKTQDLPGLTDSQ